MTFKILTVFIVVVVSCFVGVHSIYSELVPTAKKMDFHKPYPYGNFPKYHPYIPEYHVLPFPWFCPNANAPWYPHCACVTSRCCYPLCRDAPACCLHCEDVSPCPSSTTTTTTTKKPPSAWGKHHGGDDKHHQHGGKQSHKDEYAHRSGGEDDQWPGDDKGWRDDDPGVALSSSSSWAASAALRR